MTASLDFEQKLLYFRHAFDHAFAVAPATAVDASLDLLAIRVAGDPYALRVREIVGLVASRRVVPLPSRRPELLGLAGIRGSIVTVYGLAAVLGYGADSKPTPWLALAGAAESIGLAFEEFEGFLRVRAGDVYAAPLAESTRPHVRDVVRIESQSRWIVDVSSTIGTLAVHAGVAGPSKES
jgi:purine-binding chemotaxis protein CheW